MDHRERPTRKFVKKAAVCIVALVSLLATLQLLRLPLGEPRWELLRSETDSSEYRLAYLTYDETGIATNHCRNPEHGACDSLTLQQSLALSRQPANCVFSEILGFIQKKYSTFSVEDAAAHQQSTCEAVMGGSNASKYTEQANYLTVVVFVHGWQNTAAQKKNNNVIDFKKTLGRLSDSQTGSKNRVYGIYLGWPGADYMQPVSALRFWDRKRTADEVSRGDMGRDILKLHELWKLERQLAARKHNTTSDNLSVTQTKLRLVIAGHSFGGRIVYNIVHPHLLSSTLSNSIQTDTTGHISVSLICKSVTEGCRRPLVESDVQEVTNKPRFIFKIKKSPTGPPTALMKVAHVEGEDVVPHILRAQKLIGKISSDLLATGPEIIDIQGDPEIAPDQPVAADAGRFNDNLMLIDRSDLSLSYLYVDIPPPTQSKTLTGFGNLIVLLNPAFEASRYLALHEAQESHEFPDSQKPIMLVLSTENDYPTRWLFPFAKGLESGFGFGNSPRKTMLGSTIGNYSDLPFTTHQIQRTNSAGPCRYRESPEQSDYPPFVVAKTDRTFIDGHGDVFNDCVREYLERFVTKTLF